MHSFWAREAERSFLQAAQLDPEAPMPHWGIAMVAAGDYRPRFQMAGDPTNRPVTPRVKDAVRKALELSSVPGKATDLEKMYIASIAARRDEKAKDQDEAFVRGLRALVAKYPKEVEAKTLSCADDHARASRFPIRSRNMRHPRKRSRFCGSC